MSKFNTQFTIDGAAAGIIATKIAENIVATRKYGRIIVKNFYFRLYTGKSLREKKFFFVAKFCPKSVFSKKYFSKSFR